MMRDRGMHDQGMRDQGMRDQGMRDQKGLRKPADRRPGAWRGRASPERGSGTVLVIALVGLAGLLAVLVAAVASVTVARHRAAAAADLAALAAVGDAGTSCRPAQAVAAGNGAVLRSCRVLADGSVVVGVAVSLPGPAARLVSAVIWGPVGEVRAAAKAGRPLTRPGSFLGDGPAQRVIARERSGGSR
jgi:secretion/DNA translocation related TadE-like protein